ncbi:MAG: polymer-forming cytoskeletal protein [Flavobacteriaceae bacterium]|jgi:cytoskeletal protein CcmA (bactofilin family)|nr:polymer-forming cytoskeletal protein [Flavobacteriaceae bacterium]
MFSEKKQKNMDSKNNVKINFVEPNTKIIGEIESKSDFRIDGTLEGKINTSGRVVIGKEGTVNGEVHCGYADIIGNFNGSLSVDGLLTIKSDGIVEGQVTVGKLAVESGATLNAQCSMKAASVKSMVDEKAPKAEKTA